ncbi:XRCC4-like factor-domain-containing protein [Emericellopsis atlantica]|uniref:Non-homologous end-joining factor 1 n=1 Tax=Emericellopsis atlantica TaxID=2614577 RepID=A0A9P8CSV0_9HYPO|nr:XRCC4-like factor-domain-containing protein [Emericellopsis atlantica]KAG9258193.1 XRCC4-like factor-domain-containing protein [Emericellopsis atlantica]
MTASAMWQPLPLSGRSDLPVLLASFETGTTAYTLRVTDLANLWIDKLDRKAICMRAWSEEAPIDPSETSENMARLLEILRAAISPVHTEDAKATLSLAADDEALILKAHCPIPGLQPLKWPFKLSKAPPSELATSFVLPLIQAQHSRDRAIESLVSKIAQKDAVLTKLSDKLEATGTGLEHVFHTLSGKKKVSRATAESKVKGLAPFDLGAWESELHKDESPENIQTLVQDVFAQHTRYTSLNLDSSPKLDSWWLDLRGTVQLPQRTTPSVPEQSRLRRPALTDPPEPEENSADDDGFQVQATPPHLATSASRRIDQGAGAVEDDASTASEGEDDSGRVRRPSTPVSRSPKAKAMVAGPRLGAIGKRPQARADRSPSGATKTTATLAGQDTAASDTASDASGKDGESARATSPPSQRPTQRTPVKPRLGHIVGGTKKATPGQPATEDELGHVDKQPGDRAPSGRLKLGMIGKGKGAEATAKANSTSPGERGRTEAKEVDSAHRETSTERADRRREELKRELERKAAAGPVKKRRKF